MEFDVKQVIQIFKQLQNTSGKKEKENIISIHKDNDLFKQCLVFLLDDNITTGIAKKSLSKDIKYNGYIPLHNWRVLMQYLQENNTGKDADILVAQSFLMAQNEEDKWFYEGMITKSLKLGCDKKTVNKVIPELIPHWDVQLGSSFDKLKLKKNEYFYLSQKLNGIRASAINNQFISRQGKTINGMRHILNDIQTLTNGTNMFFDGELIRKNIDGITDNENFRIGTGIINSDASTKEEIKFVIFDCFPKDELKDGKSKDKYSKRKLQLLAYKAEIEVKGLTNIEIVPMVYEGTDTTEIMKWLDYASDHDWEGCMINRDTVYECKRTTNLIKVKKFFSADLEVVDVLEGEGRLKGTLGALVVKYKNNTVNVGSGYDDETRKYIWDNREDMIGKIIEVKYKEVSKDKKTGLESLQFPIFKNCRFDKTEESLN